MGDTHVEGLPVVESSQVRQVVVLDASEIDEIRAVAAEHDVAVERVPQRGMEPLVTVTVVLVGTAVAVRVVERAVERLRGSQVIDLQPLRAPPLRPDP